MLHPQHARQVQLTAAQAQASCSVHGHTRTNTHTCHRAGQTPFASLDVAANTKFLQACVWQLSFSSCLWGREKNKRQNNEGGRVYFFKQPKHGTECFHQQLLSLLCWQPAAGSSLAQALICFSLLLNALLPDIYSSIFFFFLVFFFLFSLLAWP